MGLHVDVLVNGQSQARIDRLSRLLIGLEEGSSQTQWNDAQAFGMHLPYFGTASQF